MELNKQGKVGWCGIAAVVVIVGVIIAIIWPVMTSSKCYPKRTICLNNMKQIYLAIQSYASDNAGMVPPLCGPGSTYSNPVGRVWPLSLKSYVTKGAGAFRCPLITDFVLQNYEAKSPFFASVRNSPNTTYGMNWRFGNGGAKGGDPLKPNPKYLGKTITLDAPNQPSKTVMLIETQNKATWAANEEATPSDYAFDNGGTVGGNLTPYGDWSEGRGRNWFSAVRMFDYPVFPCGHNGCNLVLADGHVQFVKAPKLAEGEATPRYSTIWRYGLTWWDHEGKSEPHL